MLNLDVRKKGSESLGQSGDGLISILRWEGGNWSYSFGSSL
jgi:hypothetical protein